ncbi:MAG: hypothetical protein J1E61_05600 [Lachnospiraceae bacterium]|nr:hypothetical protein [Lachnospiraceae bacterium]
MAYEIGGRADKYGNRFEYNWTIGKLLDVLNEKISYVIIEAIGDDEKGVDLWIGNKDGSREGQQCKGRAGSEDYWTYSSVNEKGIFINWKTQLERNESNWVSLVSPLPFTLFEDLLQRARDTDIANPKCFYNFQIKKSGAKTVTLFHQYCGVMGLDYTKQEDLQKAINYLSRTNLRQVADSQLKELLLEKINLLFIGNADDIYAKFLEYILTEDIYGKPIDVLLLTSFCNSSGLVFRNLTNDDRILPAINSLNDEYKDSFRSLSIGLIEREEAAICIQGISQGDSVIIHGSAGAGKSGCVEGIIRSLEDLGIVYLAIKLDKRIPKDTSEIWANSMGLPGSVSHCLNAVSPIKPAVLILDQLDALRWTQAHSGEALYICTKILREIELINLERTKKISIVMICRSYDLENDNNIKKLFEGSHSEETALVWQKVCIGKLQRDTIKSVVGEAFDAFSVKTQELLAIASNLYIWEQLSEEQKKKNIYTTLQLVREWWKQLKSKADHSHFSSDKLEDIKKEYVEFCDRSGRISVPESRLKISQDYCDFLQSNGFFVLSGNTISLVHQSILDCFFAEYMLDAYYEGKDLIDIIGDKKKQTPGRRYQVQMFLQQLLEESEADFLQVGDRLLGLTEIRYSFKYIFLEVLSQITEPNDSVWKVVQKYLETSEWRDHFLNTVILGKRVYVYKLRESGYFDNWMQTEEMSKNVIALYAHIAPNYTDEDIDFIEQYVLDSENGTQWGWCFRGSINEDIDSFFELRMKFYEKFPECIDQYMEVASMMKACEIRTVKILALMLKHKVKQHENNIHRYKEEYILGNEEMFVKQYRNVVEILLPFVPKNQQRFFSDWSGKYFSRNTLERTCIKIIKKANRQFAQQEPELLLKILSDYMGTGSSLHNEIVLDALRYLPKSYANYVIEYLCQSFDRVVFEDTSGNGNKLLMTKMIIEKFSKICNDLNYSNLEYIIIHYNVPNAKDRLEERMLHNKNSAQNGGVVYWKYWGDLQRELLCALPSERMSKEATELKRMLDRSVDKYSIYQYDLGCDMKNVVSPVTGKKLNYRTWEAIISNEKIPSDHLARSRETKTTFVESSLSDFANDFRQAVSNEPDIFLSGMLRCKKDVNKVFVDALIRGIAYSDKLNIVNNSDIEKMFRKYSYDLESKRAELYCHIIESKEDLFWSEDTLRMLIDIAENHKNPELGKPVVKSKEDDNMHTVEMIGSNAINSVRGVAAVAIGHLLWGRSDLLECFKEIIGKMATDENPIIRYSSLYALWPAYNIDKSWARTEIVDVFLSDYRMMGYRDRSMFFMLYDEYGEQLCDGLRIGFNSDDKYLQKVHGYTISEMYLRYGEFSDIIDNYCSLNQVQKNAIVHMFIVYLEIDKYREKAKENLIKFLECIGDHSEIADSWIQVFHKNRLILSEDKDFLMKIMTSKINQRLLYSFVNYIEKRGGILDFSDIIISMSHRILDDTNDLQETRWEIENLIPKLVLALYDETSEGRTEREKEISLQCLDIWDLLFEKGIGGTRMLSEKMTEV